MQNLDTTKSKPYILLTLGPIFKAEKIKQKKYYFKQLTKFYFNDLLCSMHLMANY